MLLLIVFLCISPLWSNQFLIDSANSWWQISLFGSIDWIVVWMVSWVKWICCTIAACSCQSFSLSGLFVVRQPFSLPIRNDRGYHFDCVGPKWVHPHLCGRAFMVRYCWPHLELTFETSIGSFIWLEFSWLTKRKFLSVCLIGSCWL
jgi:hypothetical protein